MAKEATRSLTVHVPEVIAREMKIAAINQDRPLQEVCTQVFTDYLASLKAREQQAA